MQSAFNFPYFSNHKKSIKQLDETSAAKTANIEKLENKTAIKNTNLNELTWENVDLEQGLISVKFSWTNKAGLKETKSCNDRVVDVAPRLLEILKELKAVNPDSHFVLPRSRDWEKGEQVRVLGTFLVGIGLRPVRFHDLRATFCTLLAYGWG